MADFYPGLWRNASWARLKGDGHNGDLNVTGISERGSFVNVVRGPEKWPTDNIHNEPQWVCDTVIFKLDSISPCPPLLGFGPHMTFISICRNCETFSTMDCDRIHKLSFTVALGGGGGRGSAYHLLIMTVPGTSIIGCLSAIANSPMRTMVSTL